MEPIIILVEAVEAVDMHHRLVPITFPLLVVAKAVDLQVLYLIIPRLERHHQVVAFLMVQVLVVQSPIFKETPAVAVEGVVEMVVKEGWAATDW